MDLNVRLTSREREREREFVSFVKCPRFHLSFVFLCLFLVIFAFTSTSNLNRKSSPYDQ